jgi:protein TonB
MKWLLRLYPAAFRERYGDELAALMDDLGGGPRVFIDIVRAIVRAHVATIARRYSMTTSPVSPPLGGRFMLARVGSSRTRRVVTVGMSLAVHVGIIAAVLLGGFMRVEELPAPPTVLTVVVAKPPPPPPAAPALPRAARRTPPPLHATPPELTVPELAPEPKRAVSSAATDASETDSPDAQDRGEPGGLGSGPGLGEPGNAPAQGAGPPKLLAPNVGESQRLSGEMPAYTAQARAANIAGAVMAKVCVDTHGSVTSVAILRGLPMLDETVSATVRSWRYRPFQFNGHALPFCHVARFEFRLR